MCTYNEYDIYLDLATLFMFSVKSAENKDLIFDAYHYDREHQSTIFLKSIVEKDLPGLKLLFKNLNELEVYQ